MVEPGTDEVYRWNANAFGVGVPLAYAAIIVEEASELHGLMVGRERGQLAPWSRFRAELGTEIGDVVIACHALAGFEGLDLLGELERYAGGSMWLQHAGLGPRDLADWVVGQAGKLTRAVLKREQGIRESPEFWTAEVRDRLVRVAFAAQCVAPFFDLVASDAVASRWADVSTRDTHAHRPPEAEVVAVAGYRPDDDRCRGCDPGVAEGGHTCGLDAELAGALAEEEARSPGVPDDDPITWCDCRSAADPEHPGPCRFGSVRARRCTAGVPIGEKAVGRCDGFVDAQGRCPFDDVHVVEGDGERGRAEAIRADIDAAMRKLRDAEVRRGATPSDPVTAMERVARDLAGQDGVARGPHGLPVHGDGA